MEIFDGNITIRVTKRLLSSCPVYFGGFEVSFGLYRSLWTCRSELAGVGRASCPLSGWPRFCRLFPTSTSFFVRPSSSGSPISGAGVGHLMLEILRVYFN